MYINGVWIRLLSSDSDLVGPWCCTHPTPRGLVVSPDTDEKWDMQIHLCGMKMIPASERFVEVWQGDRLKRRDHFVFTFCSGGGSILSLALKSRKSNLYINCLCFRWAATFLNFFRHGSALSVCPRGSGPGEFKFKMNSFVYQHFKNAKKLII